MKTLVLVKNSPKWEEALRFALEEQKAGKEVFFLIVDEGVSRCIRCEPELFKHLHQFVLNGGQALVCLKSLKERGIPETRPPEVFERVEDGRSFRQNFEGEVHEF